MALDPAALKRKREAMAQVASSQVYADRGEDTPAAVLTVVDTTPPEAVRVEEIDGTGGFGVGVVSTPLAPEVTSLGESPSLGDSPARVTPGGRDGGRRDTSVKSRSGVGAGGSAPKDEPAASEVVPPSKATSRVGDGGDVGELLSRISRVQPTGNAAQLPTLRVPLPEDLYADLVRFVDAVAEKYQTKVRWQALITALVDDLPDSLEENIPSFVTSRESWQLAGRLSPAQKAALEKLGRSTRPRTSSTALIQHQLRTSLEQWGAALGEDGFSSP